MPEPLDTLLATDVPAAVKHLLTVQGAAKEAAERSLRDPSWWQGVLYGLGEAGVTKGDIRTIDRSVQGERALLRQEQRLRVVAEGDTASTTVHEVLDDAPCPEGCEVPDKWHLSPTATAKWVQTEQGVQERVAAQAPLVLEARLRDVVTQTEWWRVAWRESSRWHRVDAPRGTFAATRNIVGLADHGLPVNSNTARHAVEYLSAFEATNRHRLGVHTVSSRMGWIDDVFLRGHTCHGGDVAFRGADAGDEQIARAHATRGTMETWLDAARIGWRFEIPMLGLYASLAAPALGMTGCANFVLALTWPTSRGKSTSLRLAASSWGMPDDRSPDSVVIGWDTTAVQRERWASVSGDLPLHIDDTKRAKRASEVADAVYLLCGGHGRGRGSLAGLAYVPTWRTVVLTTGEHRLCTASQDGGTRARVLDVHCEPFGGDAAQAVDDINSIVVAHHGHLGALWIDALRLPDAGDTLRTFCSGFRARGGVQDAVGGRLWTYVAHIAACAYYLHQAVPAASWATPEAAAAMVLERLRPFVLAGAADADRGAAALESVRGWVVSEGRSVYQTATLEDATKQYQPSTGWIGVQNVHGVGLIPHRLKAFLADEGHNYDACIGQWAHEGKLRCGAQGIPFVATIEGTSVRVVQFLSGVLDAEEE